MPKPSLPPKYFTMQASDLDLQISSGALRTLVQLRALAWGGKKVLRFTDQQFHEWFGTPRRTLYLHLKELASQRTSRVLRFTSSVAGDLRDFEIVFIDDTPADEPETTDAAEQDAVSPDSVVQKLARCKNLHGAKNYTALLTTTVNLTQDSSDIQSLESGEVEEERCKNLHGAKTCTAVPKTARQAQMNPHIRMYQKITGFFPGKNAWSDIVEMMDLLQERAGETGLLAELIPYWDAWRSRRRRDGAPYDPRGLAWLMEWAANDYIPPVKTQSERSYEYFGPNGSEE